MKFHFSDKIYNDTTISEIQTLADNIKKEIDFSVLDNACLLCSEDKPEHCHRRLLAEYFGELNKDIKIVHL